MKTSRTWTLYNLLMAFPIYRTANLLWFPWSISTWLGMVMMLTIAPFLWGLGIFNCLVRYNRDDLSHGAPLRFG